MIYIHLFKRCTVHTTPRWWISCVLNSFQKVLLVLSGKNNALHDRKFVVHRSVKIKASAIIRVLLSDRNSRCYKQRNVGFRIRPLLQIKLSGSPSALLKFIGSRGGIFPFILKLFTRSTWVVNFRRSCRHSLNKVLVGHYDWAIWRWELFLDSAGIQSTTKQFQKWIVA